MCSGWTDCLYKIDDFFLFQFHCGVNTVLLSGPVSPKLVDSSLSDFNPFTACMTFCHDPATLKYCGLATLSQFLAYCERHKILYTANWNFLTFVTLFDTLIRNEKSFQYSSDKVFCYHQVRICVHTTGIMECLHPSH